jgi:LPXTG-motif cell wall-anchored protein
VRTSPDRTNTWLFAGFGLIGMISIIGLRKRNNK